MKWVDNIIKEHNERVVTGLSVPWCPEMNDDLAEAIIDAHFNAEVGYYVDISKSSQMSGWREIELNNDIDQAADELLDEYNDVDYD